MSAGKQDPYFFHLQASLEVVLEHSLRNIKSKFLTSQFQGGNDSCWKDPFSVGSESTAVAATNKAEVSNGGTNAIKWP